MNLKSSLILLAAILALTGCCARRNVALPPTAATAAPLTGVDNFGIINPHFYRGAQPTDEGLRNLHNLGVDVDIDLRAEDESTRLHEKAVAESLGMTFVWIPVGGFSTPTPDQITLFLGLFAPRPVPKKIFIHCQFGQDRTGTFVAVYRMAHDHWTNDQALAEMCAFHFNWLFHPAMRRFVLNYRP